MSKVTMWRSRWRCVIKPAYSFSFLLSINIFVWQNVLYFLDAPQVSNHKYSLISNYINFICVKMQRFVYRLKETRPFEGVGETGTAHSMYRPGYWLWRTEIRFPQGGRFFSLLLNVHTCSEAKLHIDCCLGDKATEAWSCPLCSI